MIDQSELERINAVCIGYSKPLHWQVFELVLSRPSVKAVCVCGVYYGRDIAYMQAILKRLGRTDCQITGVDKFEDKECADWPAEKRGLTWEQAGFGSPPAKDMAQRNLEQLGYAERVELIASTAQDFLRSTTRTFDLIYEDTSHDYQTCIDNIRLAMPRLNPGGLMGGDDYSDDGTWGVKKAVSEAFPNHQVFGGWIWLANAADYKP